MQVSVVFAGEQQKAWIHLDVDEDCDIQTAIEKSGVIKQCPEIDLSTMKLGVFGKVSALSAKLKDGDRVEIYRPIIRDLDEDDDDDDD
ncbi:MAG: RnfH family protein [Oceanobacter sp.]